jgi:hypothetical protein
MANNSGPSKSERAGSACVRELQTSTAVRRSDSGQMSVSIGDVSQTEAFKRNLEALGRIRRMAKATAAGR